MRQLSIFIALLLTCASNALAGITVTSYRTVAQTNGYAPVSQSQYYAEQRIENVSPATADVSGDWEGTNAGGTTNTWHFVGASHATSTTTFDSNSYSVTAAASFAYQLDTVTGFIDPASSSIFAPGGAANYNGFFDTDTQTTYRMSALLRQWSRVRLNSLDGTVIFDHTNVSTTPLSVDLSGMIAPGQYRVLISASLGAPNLPNGVNHLARSGSCEDLVFTVQVPEPFSSSFVFCVTALATRTRRRSTTEFTR